MNIFPETVYEIESPEYLAGYDIRLFIQDKNGEYKEKVSSAGIVFPAVIKLPKYSTLQITVKIELKGGHYGTTS